MTTLYEEYFALRNHIVNSAEQNLNPQDMRKLIIVFQQIINSKRRSSYINSFNDLVCILEKRGSVGEGNIEPFERIINLFPNLNISNEIMSRYQSSFRNRSEGAYFSHTVGTGPPFYSHNTNYNSTVTGTSRSSDETLTGNYDALPETVINRVCRDIGTNWKDMARYLEIREGELDEIEIKYPRNLKERARECMKRFLNETDPYKVKSKLLRALVECGRRDLKEDVEEILSRRP